MHSQGLSLLELLITLSILAILTALAIPGFNAQLDASRTRAATDQLLQAIQLARSKAVSTNHRTTLRKLGTWTEGWEVFFDQDFDGVRDADEPLLFTSAGSPGAEVHANTPLNNYISFIGTGESRFAGTQAAGGFQAGTLTICPHTGGPGYQLILARSGRVRQHKIGAADCAQLGS